MHKDIAMNRRGFLKIVGISTASTTAVLTGCSSSASGEQGGDSSVPKGKMSYRKLPSIDDTVSLLGYGCMRWPTLPSPAGDGNVIDQDAVNRLVDYAIEHGVNYFDTSPVYIQGWSEKTTGNALKRHPREKFFIATKMSNFSNNDFDFGVKMYHNSFKDLQVDYIDYYLLHVVGSEGERSMQ
ncbi:MAG: aldo/keto reductase, partial [Tannerellaceae bacterium]